MEAGMMDEAMVGSVGLRRSQEGQVVIERQALSDGEVIESVRAGDRDAYRVIVDKYKRRAYHVALGLVGDPQDALDVSQTAFIKTYRSLKNFDTRRPFFPWFYRILRNLCLDHIRRSRRRREVPLTEALMLTDDSMEREMRPALWGAIEALAVEQREVIILHYFEGLAYKEMALVLGKPVGTIMSTLYYARQKLRETLRGRRSGSEKGERQNGS
jgi:RNA polymerase sigma-70 factor (ECF subfamily)